MLKKPEPLSKAVLYLLDLTQKEEMLIMFATLGEHGLAMNQLLDYFGTSRKCLQNQITRLRKNDYKIFKSIPGGNVEKTCYFMPGSSIVKAVKFFLETYGQIPVGVRNILLKRLNPILEMNLKEAKKAINTPKKEAICVDFFKNRKEVATTQRVGGSFPGGGSVNREGAKVSVVKTSRLAPPPSNKKYPNRAILYIVAVIFLFLGALATLSWLFPLPQV